MKRKFGFIEELQDTKIQDTRYRTGVAVWFFHILYLVTCNLYLAAKLQFTHIYLYFFLFPTRKAAVTPVARSSATVMESQIPSVLRKIGRTNTAATWNTRVRRKDMAADTPPFPRAVKKDEPKIPNPAKRKEAE